jgi:hypothetical protein
VVRQGADPDPDPYAKWDLLPQHENPLLRAVLRDEPRTEHLVRLVDRGHRDRIDDLLSPVRDAPTRTLVQRRDGGVSDEDGLHQEASTFDVLRMNAVDLGASQCAKNGRLRESDDIEGRRRKTPPGIAPAAPIVPPDVVTRER